MPSKAKYTGYTTEPIGSIPSGAMVKLTFETNTETKADELIITAKPNIEKISIEKLKGFHMESDVTFREFGMGYGGAEMARNTDTNIVTIIGQNVKIKKRRIKWVGFLEIENEDGEIVTYHLPEKAGFGYNTTTVKSYAANEFEHAVADYVGTH